MMDEAKPAMTDHALHGIRRATSQPSGTGKKKLHEMRIRPTENDGFIVTRVSWDPEAQRLTWTVQAGRDALEYQIDRVDATMEHAGSRRRFSGEEGVRVRVVLNAIVQYAKDSTDWWEAGKGMPVDGEQVLPVRAAIAAGGP